MAEQTVLRLRLRWPDCRSRRRSARAKGRGPVELVKVCLKTEKVSFQRPSLYRRELDHGHSKANAKVAENLYHMALGQGREAVTAAIFWLKARARWKEVSVHEHGGAGEEPLRVNVIKRIIVSPPDREELRKLPGLAINDPSWPGNPLE